MMIIFKVLLMVLIPSAACSQQLFWKKLNGPSAGSIYCIAVNKYGDVFAGTNTGISRSTDHGETWEILAKAHDLKNIYCINFDRNSNVYTSGYDSFYVSNDNGNNWKAVFHLGPLLAVREYPKVIGVDSKDIIYMGTWEDYCSGRLYSSTDYGKSWAGRDYGLHVQSVNDFLFCSNGAILAATDDDPLYCQHKGGIYISFNNGQSWKKSDDGLNSLLKWTYAFTCNSKNEIFAATTYGIYKSQTNGLGWEDANKGINITNGVPDKINDITAAPNDWLFAVNQRTCYMSKNNGESWAVNTSGLDQFENSSAPYCVAASPDGYIYLGGGLLNHNIFRSARPVVTSVSPGKTAAVQFNLKQNYPNPFNSFTTISYEIPGSCYVKLRIFDILGNEVSKLTDEYKRAGEYFVKFDGTNLPSGIFFFKLDAGGYSASKKLILLK